MPITRRAFCLTAAAMPFAARGQSAPFSAALDRARGFDQLNALVIVQGGEVRVAEALRGPAPDRPVNVKSVSKSIVAALTGIAIGDGALPGPDATLGAVAPTLIPEAAEPGVGDITVADLLTMQAGLERTSGGNYGEWVSSGDWVADALSRPFVADPGARMLYSTGSYHVLGAVLSEATGRSLLDLARDGLGAPLGIDIPPWTRDPQGRYMGGNEMALSPLALARFGEVYRRDGTYDGTRVLGADWVRASFTPRTRSVYSGHDYGYGWFLYTALGHRIAYARGYGGQFVWVVPSLDLTAVVTSDPTQPARSQGYAGALHDLLTGTILPEAGAA
jgi:CubicO group peptidase (beta-lactamase class C family)